LAAYFQRLAPTLLIDGDIIRASTKWSHRGNGKGFPFKVVDESQTAKYAREYVNGHIIIDTEANPSNTDFRQVAEGCDLLVIPAVPETTATDGLTYTLAKLYEIGNDRYRVLLTKVPPNHGVNMRMPSQPIVLVFWLPHGSRGHLQASKPGTSNAGAPMSPDLTTSRPLQETPYMFQRLERVKERLYTDALQYSLDAPQRAWYLQTTAEYLAEHL
jgi:hypothetical protein